MAPSRGVARPNRTDKNDRQKKNKPKDQDRRKAPPEVDVPVDLQQKVLDVFRDTFVKESSSNLSTVIQQIKQHLYSRDFRAAFGRQEYLQAYSARWSPSRALGYLQVFSDGFENLILSIPGKQNEGTLYHRSALLQTNYDGPIKVACLGAGAGAEIVAFAAYLHQLSSGDPADGAIKLDLIVIDSADWSLHVENLYKTVTQPLKISAYASNAIQAANIPLVNSGMFECRFQKSDLLKMDLSELQTLLQGVDLVTLNFTLNELYSVSLSLTQRFLLNLGTCLQKGALFLVVDSPGSYSTVRLNGKEKTYPMQWLLDHALIPDVTSSGDATLWTKLVSDDSRWFRLAKSLSYPIDLENMRYQIHLYQRV